MPKPKQEESMQEFMDRFMSSKEAMNSFPSSDQRAAVAFSMWEKHKGGKE